MIENIGKYRIIKEIGEGGFGTVYLVELDGKPYAMKQLTKNNMDEDICERFIREALRVEEIREKHGVNFLVKIHEVLFDDHAFVMDYIPENIHQYLARTGNEKILRELIDAVAQLHSAGIAHRDIKPANIRVLGDHPILIDFGLTSWWDSKSHILPIGTKYYSPPEIVCMFDEFRHLDAARKANLELISVAPGDFVQRGKQLKKLHDVYSLGITIGELLTQSLPFNSHSYENYLREGWTEEYAKWISKIPSTFRDFVSLATEFSPLLRRQLDELSQIQSLKSITPRSSLQEAMESTSSDDTHYVCLNCSAISDPTKTCCPKCGEKLATVGLQISPNQPVHAAKRIGGFQIDWAEPENEVARGLFIHTQGEDCTFTIGRDGDSAQFAFPDDNWMSRLHGQFLRIGNRIYYQDQPGGRTPTNPSHFNKVPVGDTKAELISGSTLIIGSTVFSCQKYFSYPKVPSMEKRQ